MKRIFFIFMGAAAISSAARGHALHVGDTVIGLTAQKKTKPALAVAVGGTVAYGALYSGAAPAGTMHVYKDAEYWLGQYCNAGQFSETGISACRDCTVGHYCPGGRDNVPCTYGAISCNGAGAATNVATAPAGAPVNKLMSATEVNAFMPVTDFAEWKQLSCCSDGKGASSATPSTLNDTSKACATGTIGPGTYLFLAHYDHSTNVNTTTADTLTGKMHSLSNVFIAVFDHPVSYASIHGANIFQHFIDTNHENYTEWTFSTAPVAGWQRNINQTNVSNLQGAITSSLQLCVYELK